MDFVTIVWMLCCYLAWPLIEPDTLKAMKCDGAQVILDAIRFGPQTSDAMQKYIAKNGKKENEKWICDRMRKAIPFMKKIGL